ncbi:MAG: hypothetical protein K2K91_03525 [Ruminococcus sp.]|nr:hypothetical protein [Ruminococcus sp.]
MKKFLLILCLPFLLMGCSNVDSNEIISKRLGIAVEESTTENLSFKFNDWQKAYKQVLLDFMNSDEYSEHSNFSLYDISTDGIPELIISPDTAHFSACSVYTYDNELIYLGKMGTYGNIGYCEDSNIIELFNQGQGIETYIFCQLENNEILYLDSFYNDELRSEQATYKHNDTELTKEEYNKKLEKYIDSKFIWLGLDYSFDEIADVLWE